MSHKHTPSKIGFRPFPSAAPTQDAATLRRRAYHIAGHALMANQLQIPSFYFLLMGRSVGLTVRAGEIDIVGVYDGNMTWSSHPDEGWSAAPEWAELMGSENGEIPADQQCFMLAAGCAAEILHDPSTASLTLKQATGDRACFHRLLSISHHFDQAVLEAAECLAEDRVALNRIAEVVERSLQVVHFWSSKDEGIPNVFGLTPGVQFREAALFSEQVNALAIASRLKSNGKGSR
jgi:hypothetical protein